MAISNKEVLGKEIIVQKAELENVLQFILLFILLLHITELKVHSELFPLFFFRQRNMLQKGSSLFLIHLNQVTLLSLKNRKDV